MAAIRLFLLLMQLHPEVAAKARKEIDSVVGAGRLPTFNDRPSLPYVDAVILSFLICERMRREEEAVSMLETRWTRGW